MDSKLGNNSQLEGINVAPKAGEDQNRSIPVDVIDGILSRLPVKSLIRFQTLSKLYRSTISSPWFSKISYNHQLKNSHNLFLHLTRKEDGPSNFALVRLEGENFQTEAHLGAPFGDAIPLCCSNGIVLLVWKEGFILWNPSIRRYTMIPSPPNLISWLLCFAPSLDFWLHVGLYIDSRTDDYKVVVICTKYKLVFSCKTTTWSNEETSPFSELNLETGVFVDGCFYYWQSEESGEIVCYDFRERKIGMLKRLDMNVNPTDLVMLSTLRGRLCVYCVSRDGRRLQGWVMQKEAQEQSWMELKNTDKMGPHFSFPGRFSIGSIFYGCSSRFIIYNQLNKSFEQSISISGVRSIDLLPFSESLFFPF